MDFGLWDATFSFVCAIILVIFILFFVGVCFGAQYRHDGPAVLNDLKATPGAVRTTKLKDICPHADTKAVRHVTESEKKQACKEYGLKPAQCMGTKVEFDHLISLELGGSNLILNLWPEPQPQAREMKDKVEDWVHGQVCKGKIPLGEAQRWMAEDWYSEWHLMENK